MDEFIFDRDAYLKRIGFTGDISATVDCLRELHHAHQFTIPFENFDIALGRGISLEPEKLIQKLVHSRRGGYCFEVNGLMLMALKSFGFEARALLGRVHIREFPTGRGHQISLVTIGGEPWIVDVGFGGDTPRAPLPLILDQPVSAHGQTVRLVRSRLFGTMLQKHTREGWSDLYSFDMEHVCQGDIDYGNHYTSTSPKTFFVTGRTAALPVEGGLITLINMTLRKRIGGEVKEIELEEGEAYLEALKTHFGIELDAPYEALRPLAEA